MSRSDLLRQFYQDVWNNSDFDAMDRFFAPNAKAAGIVPKMQFAPSDFRDLAMAVSSLLTDLTFDCLVTVEQGDWVAALIRARAIRIDTGTPIDVSGQTMVRFDGDRICEAYNQFDYISFFEQLGQLPPDTLPVCLTGQQLTWA